MSMKMRDLIRAVRSCKTAAEERAVISKECALIRTAIKEEDEANRYRNVAKLMYIHMLGYPTHFGQMECLKLISAPTFPDKRIGYLALTLLLNEQAEVLTLVTNSLKLDLSNPNQYIQALALVVIGNLATQDMARDLASDVDKLLRSSNAYLRKKAALAAIRLLKKEPDLIESFGERIVALLKDRAHGVLLTGIQLMIDVLALIPEMKEEYCKLVPALVRLLRNFISMGFSPEHDVAGITDPFMQVKILRILRLLGKENAEVSEQMNDVLAQVATNTETTKNAGNAILYECVQTIMDVESDSSLRVLAVNILGRFLLNRDNNIRYVALNSLTKVVNEDISAVQRHRATIVECLKDADISIRHRALELIYQLVNDQNVVSLTTELLNYLIIAQADQKVTLTSKIMQIVEKYSPSKKWRVDTIITMLSLAGNQADESVLRTAIMFLAQTEGFQGYAAHKLYRNLLEDTSQMGLLIVSSWIIGEFGELLPRECNLQDTDGSYINYPAVYEHDVTALLDRCIKLHNADVGLKAIILTALVKLSARFSMQSRPAISEILRPFKSSITLELQQRSVEFSRIISSSMDGMRQELLGKMPIMDEATLRKRRSAFEDGNNVTSSSEDNTPSLGNLSTNFNASFSMPSSSANATSGGGGVSLLDLDDIFGGSSAPAPTSVAMASPSNVKSTPSNNDLLGDIFSTPVSAPAPVSQNSNAMNNVLDIFNTISMNPMPPQQSSMMSGMSSMPAMTNNFGNMNMGGMMSMSAAPMSTPMMQSIPTMPVSNVQSIKAFEKNGFSVIFEYSKPNPATPALTRILAKFSNTSSSVIDSLSFQAAVPKYLKLEMLPPTSTVLPPGTMGNITQDIKITNSQQGEKNIMMKLKINFKQGGIPVEELVQVSSFPPLY